MSLLGKNGATERERQIFLEMAETWLKAAAVANRRARSTEPASNELIKQRSEKSRLSWRPRACYSRINARRRRSERN